jgi:hypothetical protein
MRREVDAIKREDVADNPVMPPAPTSETVPTPFVQTTPPVAADPPVPTDPSPHPNAPPIQATTATPPAPPATEVDSRGIPWDPRIHGGTEAKKAVAKDGTWKKKRRVDATYHAQIEAELAATAKLPQAAAAPPPPPVVPETPGLEPPPVTFGDLLAAAGNDIGAIGEAVKIVSGGQFTTAGEISQLPAWVQATYDYLQRA